MTEKIIIDTDPGQDDAVAILLALASPELEVLGLTAVTGNVPLAQGGFLTARCAGPAKYFQVVEAVYRSQDQVMAKGEAYDTLAAIAKDAGLTQDRFDACLRDEAANAALEARSDRAAAEGVNATPAFYVAGKAVDDHSLEGLDAAIRAALKPAAPKRRR